MWWLEVRCYLKQLDSEILESGNNHQIKQNSTNKYTCESSMVKGGKQGRRQKRRNEKKNLTSGGGGVGWRSYRENEKNKTIRNINVVFLKGVCPYYPFMCMFMCTYRWCSEAKCLRRYSMPSLPSSRGHCSKATVPDNPAADKRKKYVSKHTHYGDKNDGMMNFKREIHASSPNSARIHNEKNTHIHLPVCPSPHRSHCFSRPPVSE